MSNLTPPSFTESERIKTAIQGLTHRVFMDMAEAQRRGIELVWRGQQSGIHSLTPQQVCDALGTQAAALFTFHGQLTRFLLEQAAADGITANVLFPTNAFTENPDGTITIDPNTPYTFTP